MAVPTSGVLTMLGLAQEALYGTYGSGTIAYPIHMYDLVNGGNSAGSGNSYPAVNTNCTPNPASGGTSSFYAITLTLADNPGTNPEVTVYTTRNPITGLVTNDVLYYYIDEVYVAWTGASQTYSYWIYNQGTFFGCTSVSCPNISVSSSGVVTTNGCQCP